jgi:hypothetical protein
MKVIELKGSIEYVDWMRENDGKYKIVRLSATNLSSSSWPGLASAFIGDRNITIVYEEKN